jgi:protein-tyrosine-phosphatase
MIDVENNFKYHSPTPFQLDKYDRIRVMSKELAKLLIDLCPESREKSLAITKLEECSMWANASIARNE